MSFIIDGLNRGIAFSKIGIKDSNYHLCLQIWGNETSVSLLNNEIKFEEQIIINKTNSVKVPTFAKAPEVLSPEVIAAPDNSIREKKIIDQEKESLRKENATLKQENEAIK